MVLTFHQPITAASAVQRRMSIQQALEWAFVTEKAQIDFDTTGAREFDRVGVDPLWRGMQMAILGTSVDGGGSSDPAADAQIIASYVEALPIEVGGRRMATQVAELARLRSVPDWGKHDRIAVVPFGYDWCEDTGAFVAGTAKRGSLWSWRDEYRKRRETRGVVCPVVIEGTAKAIAAKRQNYLAWFGALLHLHGRLQGVLHGVELSDVLPPMTPWRVGQAEQSEGEK